MYQLLMTGWSGWAENRGSINRTRVFEHTQDSLAERFKPGGIMGQLDVAAVCRLPTIFAGESQHDNPAQVARLGTIINVTPTGADYLVEYVFDLGAPPITNTKLEELAGQLEIDNWEFSRNHWAIKDVDLYKVLFRNDLTQARKPRVFELAPPPLDDGLVSVMMPFAAEFGPVYTALQAAVAAAGKRCQRADDIWNHDTIIQDVVTLISRAKVVICDLSGKNPNVFYEAGIAHAIGANVILIAQHADDVPFDLRHLRYIPYLRNGEGLVRLTEVVTRRLQTLAER